MDIDLDRLTPSQPSTPNVVVDLLDLNFMPDPVTSSVAGYSTNQSKVNPQATSLIDIFDGMNVNGTPESNGEQSGSNDVLKSADVFSSKASTPLEPSRDQSLKSQTLGSGNGDNDLGSARMQESTYDEKLDDEKLDSENVDDNKRSESETINEATDKDLHLETDNEINNGTNDGTENRTENRIDNEVPEGSDHPKKEDDDDSLNTSRVSDNEEILFDVTASRNRKSYIGNAADKLHINPIELVLPYCTIDSLLNLGMTSHSTRSLMLDCKKWQECCSKLSIVDTTSSISDGPNAANILRQGYVAREHSAFYTFLRAYDILIPIIMNPSDELKAFNANQSKPVEVAAAFTNAWSLASILDLDEPVLSKLREIANKAQNNLLEEISEESIRQSTLPELFEASELWEKSPVNTNMQEKTLAAYFCQSTPIISVDDVFTFKGNSDAGEKQTSQRKISAAFNQVTTFLIHSMADINDPTSPLPQAWRDPAWSFTLSKAMGDLVIFVQKVLTEAAKDISELEYLQTVPRVYIAAEQISQNSVLREKAVGANFNIETYVDNALLRPMLDEFTDRQITYVDRFARLKVKEWNDNLSQQETETEEFLWSSVPKKADKTDFISSFKWAFALSAVEEEPQQTASSGSSTNIEAAAPATEFEAQTAVLLSKLKRMEKLVSFELALEVMEACKAGIQRLRAVNRATAKTAEPLFVTFLQIVGKGHIQKAFEKAVKVLNSYDPKKYGRLMVPINQTADTNMQSNVAVGIPVQEDDEGKSSYAVEPLAIFTELVNVGDLVQQMVHVFFDEELVATKLVRPNNFGTPSVNAKRQFEQMLDDFLAEGLNRGIDVLMDQVEFTLTTEQLGSDYLPVPNQPIHAGQTVACEKVISLVKSHLDLLRDSTEKGLFDVFQQEVGIRLFSALSKHIKKQTISVDGAINLIADANAYYSFISLLKQKNLTAYYEALKQVAQLFLIDKRDARQIGLAISDSSRYNNVLSAEDIIEFVKRRQDWPLIKSKVEKVLYGLFNCTIC